MINIKIYDLQQTQQLQSLLADLTFHDDISVFGGRDENFPVLVNYAIKSMQFVLLAYAIDSVSYLATSFNNNYY